MEQSQNVTLRDYVRVLFRQKFVLCGCFLVVMLSVYLALEFSTPLYEAQVKMLVSAVKQTSAAYYRGIVSTTESELGLTQSEVVKSMPVMEETVKALRLAELPLDYEKKFASPLKGWVIDLAVNHFTGKLSKIEPPLRNNIFFRRAIEKLRKKIEIEPIRDTDIFLIKVQDYHPVMAAMIANVVSRTYVIFDLHQLLAELQLKYGEKHPIIRQLQDNLRFMNQNLNGEPLRSSEAIGPGSVKIIEQAYPPIEPVGPPRGLIFILAFIFSIFLGVMLAFIVEYLDHTIKSPKELETLLNLPLLGTIPRTRLKGRMLLQNTAKSYVSSTYVGAYRSLSDQIRLLIKNKGIKSLLITGPETHEGSTTVISNLAFYLAHHVMINVLVVDANFRNTSIHKIFKIDQGPGLADILFDKAKFDDVILQFSPHLCLMPAGVTNLNPVTFLDSPKLKEVLDEAKRKFDIILVDCADLKHYKDSITTAAAVDGVILLVSENRTRRHAIEEIVMPLKEYRSNLVGTILNNRTFVIPKFIYNRI